MVDTEWLSFALYIVFTLLINIPFHVYCAWQLWFVRSNIIIHKRFPQVTVIYIGLRIIILLIERGIFLLAAILYGSLKSPLEYHHPSTHTGEIALFYVHQTVFSLCNLGSTCVLLLRYYMIFWAVQWTKSTLSSKWIVHLNHLDLQRNFYITHHSTFGSLRYASKVICILCLSMAVVSFISYLTIPILGLPVFSVIQLIINVAPLIALLAFWFKMRSFKDDFFIIQEFRAITIIIIVGLIMYLIIATATASMNGTYWRSFLITFEYALLSIPTVWIQTKWIINKIANSKVLQYEMSRSNQSGSNNDIWSKKSRSGSVTTGETTPQISQVPSDTPTKSPSSPSTSLDEMIEATATATIASMDFPNPIRMIKKKTKSKSKQHSSTIKATLDNVFKNEESFELFMNHLAKEWSMELALALLEFTHFQQLVKATMMENKDDERKIDSDIDDDDDANDKDKDKDKDKDNGSLFEMRSTQKAILRLKSIPKSFVVNGDIAMVLKEYKIDLSDGFDLQKCDEMTMMKIRCYVLYYKYVDDASALQINLPHRQRAFLDRLMENKQMFIQTVNIKYFELFDVYSDCIKEVIYLLTGAYYRHTHTGHLL